MKNCRSDSVSLSDFMDKCRFCLKNVSDMIDILASGISDQVMQLINIKITYNDKLPRAMCQGCHNQLEEMFKFQNLAKDSDNYLRSLLLAEESSYETDTSPRSGRKKRHLQKGCTSKKVKDSKRLRNDKMYLILVSDKSDANGEICIKDLGVESENVELTDFCRSIVKSKTHDHTYLGEKMQRWQELMDNRKELAFNNSELGNDELKIEQFRVNEVIYQCSKCDESFESYDLLGEHLISSHKVDISPSMFRYVCPVCSAGDSDRSMFMQHLQQHKDEGYSFMKVDKNGEYVPLTELEDGTFEMEKLAKKSNVRNRVYKMNVDCYECMLCHKLESVNLIEDHLRVCFPAVEENACVRPHIKYTCPACCQIWIDDVDSYHVHLVKHRDDNVFFIKVNKSGERVEVGDDEAVFTQFEKALEALTFERESIGGDCDKDVRVCKVGSPLSCGVCGHDAESDESLNEHYLNSHNGVSVLDVSCPVCSEEFKFNSEKVRLDYITHLRTHRNEGVHFLNVRMDGSVVNGNSYGFDVFTSVNDFFNGLVGCSELEYLCDVYVPLAFMQRATHVSELFEGLPHGRDVCVLSETQETHVLRRNSDYVCEKCGRKCFGKGNYRRHLLSHVDKSEEIEQKRPKCAVCNKTFSSQTTLSEHRKYHSKEDVVEEIADDSLSTICEICGRKLSNSASLTKHRRLHASAKEDALFHCKICQRRFRREASLNRHVSAHLNPNYFECDECKLPLPSTSSLHRHKLGHRTSANTYDCKVCKVSFLSKDRLTAHQTHAGHHQDRKRFECNVCHERFFVAREFTRHIKLHPKYKMSECTLCGKRLSTVQSLMLHLGRHFESNSILCPHCGKQFFEERNYHRHLLTHEGVKPFGCDVEGCKKSFYTYFELNRHKKYHNNTRDFSCSYCPKSFHEANHLKVHIRTHTGERPYTCPHCNKGFVTRTRCKQHINLIHQGIGCDMIQTNISKKVAVFEALETVSY